MQLMPQLSARSLPPCWLVCAFVAWVATGCHGATTSGTSSNLTKTDDLRASTRMRWGESVLYQKSGWYASKVAKEVADSVLLYQSSEGGWPKNTDLATPPTPTVLASISKEGKANTIDNHATTVPLRFLGRMVQVTSNASYQASFKRGLDYLLTAQYANGGWPQFHPVRPGYYAHITYNDNAMVNALNLLRDIAAGRTPYEFVDKERRERCARAVQRGIDCILRTQYRQNGTLTVWCAQHDEKTLAPAWARNFEPPSLSGAESVGVVRFLMSIEQPTPEVVAAVEGAMTWFKAARIDGLSYHRGLADDGQRDGWVVKDDNSGPLWARFYELESNRPVFLGRDKVFHYSLHEIERERRAGYVYYGSWAADLIAEDYPRWRAKHGLP